MSDPQIRGLLSAVGTATGEALAKQHALPPDARNANRAYTGAFLVGTTGRILLGPEASSFPDEWKLGLAGAACLGLLLLVVGWRGARGARDPLGALFALGVPACGWVAVTNYAPALLALPFASEFCTGIFLAALVRCWLSIRGPGTGNARQAVRHEISQNEIIWRGVKRR
jgi:hypothetical protein